MGSPRPERASSASRVAHAFAPGHLTGLFTPDLDARDPRARGSRGAGIVLSLGVTATATWDPFAPSRFRLTSDTRIPLPISRDVARRLRRDSAGALDVSLRHDLPIGQGIGMSAAGATATALAVARVLRLPPHRAIETAHLAELFGGGGLGGVAAIQGGGWELRRRAGVPPWGHVEHRPFRPPIFIVLLGQPLASPRLLSQHGFLDRVRHASDRPLRTVESHPSVDRMLEESERFSDALGLGSPALRRVVHRLRSSESWVSQAMFGRCVFAVPRAPRARARLVSTLTTLGLRAVELRAASRGAFSADGPPSLRSQSF
jgi:pantoate kinase